MSDRSGKPSSAPLAIVTGGAGGIGNHLVAALRKRRWRVRIVDNFSSGTRENLKRFEGDGDVEVVEMDVLDLDGLKKVLKGVDFVWHLSANPDIRKGTEFTDLDLQQGPVATRNVLEAMRANGVKKIAFSSSSVVYGYPKVFPTPEDYGPLLPESLYGASKLACEGLITAFSSTFGMKGWIFRFANIVGPGATHGVIYDFVMKLERDPTRLEILGDGKQAKGYMWVTDCVDAMIHCTEKTTKDVNVFNLAPDDTIAVSEIGKQVLEQAHSKARIEYTGGKRGWAGDIPQQRLDGSRLKATGFKLKYDSAETVRMAIKVTLEERQGR
jgi:UDP-glucose 4-epimerase